MTSVVQKLFEKQFIKRGNIPSWLPNCIQYETIMGSEAYGCAKDFSDKDMYGFCIPSKEHVISNNELIGFGSKKEHFEQWQLHHIMNTDNNTEYDCSIYNITKYFQLVMENNPNMIDSLFTPIRCVVYSTNVGNHIRANRNLFLHKGAYHKFRGYAYQQMHKIRTKQHWQNEKRREDIDKFGYSTKYAMHLVRLLEECKQILIEESLDLERNREMLKTIREGQWTLEQIEKYMEDNEKVLGDLYLSSKLQHKPDEDKIESLLFECLEMYYGSIDKIEKEGNAIQLLNKIREILS